MKNKTVILLLLIAIPLYLWDSHALLNGIFNRGNNVLRGENKAVSIAALRFSAIPARFVEKGRSPFTQHKETVAPVANTSITVKKVKTGPIQKPSVSPPKVTVTGIMWHPTNPIAMITLPDGSSSAVKTGQTIGNIFIKTVEKTRVLIVYEKEEFWIAR